MGTNFDAQKNKVLHVRSVCWKLALLNPRYVSVLRGILRNPEIISSETDALKVLDDLMIEIKRPLVSIAQLVPQKHATLKIEDVYPDAALALFRPNSFLPPEAANFRAHNQRGHEQSSSIGEETGKGTRSQRGKGRGENHSTPQRENAVAPCWRITTQKRFLDPGDHS